MDSRFRGNDEADGLGEILEVKGIDPKFSVQSCGQPAFSPLSESS
jgi:hypothetical protein